MSTQSHSAGIKQETHVVQGHGHPHATHAPHAKWPLPIWLVIAFALVIVAGAVCIFGRGYFAENAAFQAMLDCDAHVKPEIPERDGEKYVLVRPNGLEDGYAFIHFTKEREAIANVVSLCDVTDRAMGLRLFRRAFKEGNRSAKIIALYCADYLAHAQVTPFPHPKEAIGLAASDVESIVDELDAAKEPDLEVRKAALHALGDLVELSDAAAIAAVKADAKADNKYTKISPGVLAAATAALDADAPKDGSDTKDRRRDLKIATHEETVWGKDVLYIRWSTPAMALAWWKENAKEPAKWNPETQRYVFP